MAEKLCLQWNDFQDNVKNVFGHLRDSTDFVDVALACEDGQNIEAHKVILSASSPFFQRILKGNQHSHPLIYMRGMKSNDLTAIMDLLYYGEAKVYQENLDSFLAIAGELQLMGLEGSQDQQETNEEDQLNPTEMHKTNHMEAISRTQQIVKEKIYDPTIRANNALALPKSSVQSTNLQELDETVKAMMETSENMIQVGQKVRHAKICKVCGKEGQAADILRHIEANHLEGVSVPCNLCGKLSGSRNALTKHISRFHKEHLLQYYSRGQEMH